MVIYQFARISDTLAPSQQLLSATKEPIGCALQAMQLAWVQSDLPSYCTAAECSR